MCWFSGGDSDLEMGEDEDFSKLYSKGPPPNSTTYSYLSLTDSSHSLPGGGASFDLSPLSSPEKDLDGKYSARILATSLRGDWPVPHHSQFLYSIMYSTCLTAACPCLAGNPFHMSSDLDMGDAGGKTVDQNSCCSLLLSTGGGGPLHLHGDDCDMDFDGARALNFEHILGTTILLYYL